MKPTTSGRRSASAPERIAGAAASTLVDVYSLGRLLEALLEDPPPDADLAAVAARATADQPEARYPSVDALIDDLRDHLSGRPVAARGGGRRYAAAKFVRRHSRAVAASSGAVALLVVARVVTLFAYAAADRARAAEARRFGEVRALAGFMLFDLNDRLERVAGNTQARAALAAEAQTYLSALATTTQADRPLRLEAARGLIALARAQGVPGQPNLGETDRARSNLQMALRLLTAGGAGGDAAPDVADALAGLALIDINIDSARESAARRLARAEAALAATAAGARDDRWRLALSGLRRVQLDTAVLDGRPEDLPPLAERLQREVEQWPASMRGSLEAELALAYADQNRAIHGYLIDSFPPGVAAATRAERRLLRLDAARPNDPDVLYALAWNSYAGHGTASGIPDGEAEAEPCDAVAEQAVGRLLRLEENDMALRSFYAQTAQMRSHSLSGAGRHREAIAAQRQVLARFEAALGPRRRPGSLNRLAMAHVTMGKIAIDAADRPLACASFGRARAVMAELQARDELLGMTAAHLRSATDNIARCARGEPVSEFMVFE